MWSDWGLRSLVFFGLKKEGEINVDVINLLEQHTHTSGLFSVLNC